MRSLRLAAVSCIVALATVALATVSPSFARPLTTNQPAILSVKVTIKDASVAMRPNHAARGSTVTFILTNRGKKKHTFQIGDIKRGTGFGSGFARTLSPDQQVTVVMYLDYRGLMHYSIRPPHSTKRTAKGAFRII